jgi:NitT/TauT family transport system ATP-binding protein
MAKIECRNLTRTFSAGAGSFAAVEDLTFTIEAGELVSVVGKTGCGKSSTLNILLGLDRPSEGRLTIGGKEPYDDFDYFRGKLSAVFQTDRLLPWRKILDNAAYGLEILGVPAAERYKRARHWLDKVGLDGFTAAYPHQLSGGMRQRVGIARAFCIDPDVILCDEAFGHLDEVTATQLRADFLNLVRETGKTSIFITHDIGEAIELGSRVLVLGKPAHLLWDIAVTPGIKADPEKRAGLKDKILKTIEANGSV